jgi:hypothetical protein
VTARLAAVVVCVALAGGCAGQARLWTPLPVDPASPTLPSPARPSAATVTAIPQATPEPTKRPAATSTPRATPEETPAPVPATQPPELPLSATVRQDGVRVTVTLARNPLPAGRTTSAEMVVTNTGDDDLIWFHDGCAILAHVRGTMTTQRWRFGAIQDDPKKSMFKRYIVGTQTRDGGEVRIRFVPRRYFKDVSIACPDIGIGDAIKPGDSIHEKAIWDGTAVGRWGLPPAGPVSLVATFTYWRANAPPDEGPDDRIDVHMEGWISSDRDERLLHPGEVVDAALASVDFSAWLDTVDIANGNEPVLWFDRERGLWEVGNLDYTTEKFHFALVDPMTGAVVDTIERDWDYEADGQP